MRVARRSHLSRIASDDDWFQDSWWEDGSPSPVDMQERRRQLHGPQIAGQGAPDNPAGPNRDSPLFDPRIAKGTKRNAASKRQKHKQ